MVGLLIFEIAFCQIEKGLQFPLDRTGVIPAPIIVRRTLKSVLHLATDYLWIECFFSGREAGQGHFEQVFQVGLALQHLADQGDQFLLAASGQRLVQVRRFLKTGRGLQPGQQ